MYFVNDKEISFWFKFQWSVFLTVQLTKYLTLHRKDDISQSGPMMSEFNDAYQKRYLSGCDGENVATFEGKLS